MNNMKYLIIGSEGFIGRALWDNLSTVKGSIITGIDTKTVPVSSGRIVHNISIRDTGKLVALCEKEGFDTVFNLTGVFNSSYLIDMFDLNCFSPYSFIESTKHLKHKVVLIGSAAEYGVTEEGVRIDESHPLNPISDYGISKACQTFMALRYADKYKCPAVVIARPFNLIGPGMLQHLFLGAFAKQIVRIEKGLQEPIIKVGNISAYRDILPVTKVAECLHVLSKKGVNGNVYNICSGRPFKIEDMLKELINMSKINIKIEVCPKLYKPNDIPWSVGDNKKISKFIKIAFDKNDLVATIKQTLDWVRDND